MKLYYLFFLVLLISLSIKTKAQVFSEQTNISLQFVEKSSVAWGDYDNDGDLDILLTGRIDNQHNSIKIYQNDTLLSGQDRVFIEKSIITVNGIRTGTVVWGDYDNDGDLDILLSGESMMGYITKICRNEPALSGQGRRFVEQTAIVLTGVFDASVAWGDYDNDGDLDFILTGYEYILQGQQQIYRRIKIYRNEPSAIGNNRSFVEQTGIHLDGVGQGSVAWGDYDNDGYLDILMTGYTNENDLSIIYHNDPLPYSNERTFSKLNAIHLKDVGSGDAVWGDYDNDGDLDILLTGYYHDNNGNFYCCSKIYKNIGGGNFHEQTGISLVDIFQSSTAWGDYNNDGYLDILITGQDISGQRYTKIYKNVSSNQGRTFLELSSDTLTNVSRGAVAWGDYDNDGDLDILLTGNSINGKTTKLYRNNTVTSNIPPSIPSGLNTLVIGNRLLFSWNKSTDNNADSNALSYNIRIGSSAKDIDLKSPQSDIINGYHRIAGRGMVQDTFYYFKIPDSLSTCKKIFWSVQAIDAGFEASKFSLIDSAYNPLTINISTDKIIVAPNDTFLMNVSHNACGNVTYNWSPAAYLDDANIQTPKASISKNTVFTVTVSENGQSVTDSIKIDIEAFTEQKDILLAKASMGTVNWFDYDNDGDLDILLTGKVSNSNYISKIYRNDTTNQGQKRTFTEQTDISLSGVYRSSTDIGDYDNDGFLDIVLAGASGNSVNGVTKLFKNTPSATDEGRAFIEQTGASLTAAIGGAIVMGDYDNDGYLDILATGEDNDSNRFTKIYRNEPELSGQGRTYVEQKYISLKGLENATAAWGDYDNDGDLDILLTGDSTHNSLLNKVVKVYRNDKSLTDDKRIFTEHPWIFLSGVKSGSVSWGDYDDDGYLDILLTGNIHYKQDNLSKIYRNEPTTTGVGRTFTYQNKISIRGVTFGAIDWGDYDNDGDLDILLTGEAYNDEYGKQIISKIYRNEIGHLGVGRDFIEQKHIHITAVSYSSVEWGDYDNDGDLDIILMGQDKNNNNVTKVYRNNSLISNKPPIAPKELKTQLFGDSLILSWNKSADDKTSVKGLNYNISIGNNYNDISLKSPQSDFNNGFHRLSKRGFIQDTSYIFIIPESLKNPYIYWSVQAIDHGYLASPFARVDSIKIFDPASPSSSDLSIMLFPNPNEGSFIIDITSSLSEKLYYQLEIFNILGTLVYSEQISVYKELEKNIFLNNISNGIYILRLQSDKNVINTSFIVY